MTLVAPQLQQHRDISALISQIAALSTSDATISTQAAEIRRLMVLLSGKLNVHLAGEDKVVYPALAQSANREVAAVALRFQREMGGLMQAFKGFSTQWTEIAIKANPTSFMADLHGIAKAVADRVGREEKELYPLVDAAQKTASG